MENIPSLHWQLSVLSKAIHYKNLSGAASHVGLSQPQLSRIIARLEEELGVVLLDRSARRKSGWTPIAFKVAETYFQSSRQLTHSLQELTSEGNITSLTVGTLEGLIPLANTFCQQLFSIAKMHSVELDVYDLGDLEDRFEKDKLDLIFTCREPGRHKYKNVRNLGYQVVEKTGNPKGIQVFSAFDYANHLHNSHRQRSSAASGKDERVLISNSLAVRRSWIEDHDCCGIIPSDVRQRKSSEKKAGHEMPVLMMASDMFNPQLWQKLEQFEI
jgi:LysR family transcriptional regulator, transcriptional activator for aaeXAB operon